VLLEGTEIGSCGGRRWPVRVAVVPQYSALAFPFLRGGGSCSWKGAATRSLALRGRRGQPHRPQGHGDDGHAGLAARDMESLSGGERQRVLIAGPWPRSRGSCSWTSPRPSWTSGIKWTSSTASGRSRDRGSRHRRDHDINLAAQLLRPDHPAEGTVARASGSVDAVITEENIRKAYETRVMVDRHPGTGSPRITLT